MAVGTADKQINRPEYGLHIVKSVMKQNKLKFACEHKECSYSSAAMGDTSKLCCIV